MKLVAQCLLAFLLVSGPLAAEPTAAQVDKVFASWRTGPGGAVGVVSGDKLVFSKGYGMADVAKNVPNTPQTLFDLASVSKQFTATAVLIQAQKGKLAITAPLGEYLPGLPAYAAKTPLKNLLGMTSGFPEYDVDEVATRATLIATLMDENPSFKAGAQYEYLNMNYALLTFVVQKVASQSLGQVLKNTIFSPLKMTHTVFLSKKGQKIPGRAVGYSNAKKSWTRSVSDAPGVGDGNIFSSVDDLSLWARDLLRGSSVLSPESLKAAWTPGVLSNGKKTGYGLGFEIDQHVGQTRVSHTGAWYGASNYIAFYPKSKLAVIVLSNREESESDEMGEQVEDLYLR